MHLFGAELIRTFEYSQQIFRQTRRKSISAIRRSYFYYCSCEELQKMAQNANNNEVEQVVKQLKQNDGYAAYIILNNDGIVIKYENMEYERAVHYAALVLDLYAKAGPAAKLLLDETEDEVESIRVRTETNELIVAQHGHYTMVVIQEEEKSKTDSKQEDSSSSEVLA